MSPPTERSRQLHVMLSEDEERFLRAIAEADGLSTSDVVRQWIRREFFQRWPPKKPKK